MSAPGPSGPLVEDILESAKEHQRIATILLITGFPQALEIMETWKITKNSSMHGKIMKF